MLSRTDNDHKADRDHVSSKENANEESGCSNVNLANIENIGVKKLETEQLKDPKLVEGFHQSRS